MVVQKNELQFIVIISFLICLIIVVAIHPKFVKSPPIFEANCTQNSFSVRK